MSADSPKIVHIVKQVEAESAGKHRDRFTLLPTREDIKIELTKNQRDVPHPSLQNVCTILGADPEWANVLAFDEFSRKIIKRSPPPFDLGAAGEWSDFDDSSATLWIARTYGINFRTLIVVEAVPLVARQHGFHPILDYIEGLEWDGTPRLRHGIAAFFGGEQSDYNARALTKWMTSAVARIYDPGCKADCVLILEGAQGKGKTTALSVLAGKDHFLDTALEIGNKDTLLAMRGKWIIEFGELDSLSRAETSRIKQFLSATTDTVRDPFARRAQDHPRHCVFAGSTNLGEYLKDETGNRRFWPVKCGNVDVDELAKERNQLWAEAANRYRAGASWWITPDDLQLFEPEQDARYQADEWEGIIADKLRLDGAAEVTLGKIMCDALGIESGRMDRSMQTRAGNCMKRLGWIKRRVMRGGIQRNMYFQPDQIGKEVCR